MQDTFILIDDEIIQLEGLRHILLSAEPGAQIFIARDGRQALDMIEKMPPDNGLLIFSDIRMPGMDGLDFLAELRRQENYTPVIIISAYSEFDYAKQAIHYGATDYLLKPYKPADILQAIHKVRNSPAFHNKEENMNVRLDMLLSRFLSGELTSKERSELASWIKWQGGVVAAARVPINGLLHNPSEYVRRLARQFGKYFETAYPCTFLQNQADFALVLPGITPEEAEVRLSGLINELDDEAPGIGIGVSENIPGLLSGGYKGGQQAQEALAYRFYPKQERVLMYKKLERGMNAPLPDVDVRGLSDATFSRNTRSVYLVCKKMRDTLMNSYPLIYPGRIKKYVGRTVMSLLAHCTERDAAELNRKEFAYSLFAEANTLDGLISACHTIILDICTEERGGGSNKSESDLISDCLAWMEKNLEKNFSLQEAAERFYFNPNYFSGLIKRRTGASYSQYMARLKMNRARELLSETDLRVQEVAVQTGYRDPSYFNRVFRQENGMAPDQYRRRNRRKDVMP